MPKVQNKMFIEIFKEGQLYVLKNGKVIFIHEVCPFNAIHNTDSDRYVKYMNVKATNNVKLESDTVDLKDNRNDFYFKVNASEIHSTTYDKLYNMIGSYLGFVSDDASTMINRIINDRFSSDES